MKTKKYICLENYVNDDGLTCFKKNNVYLFEKITKNVFFTLKNEFGYSHKLDDKDIKDFFKALNTDELQTPKHYDNSKGSIYQFCENQKLNSYEFEVIKRIVRCRKKGEFLSDIKKTIQVLEIYLQEQGEKFKGENEILNK